MKYLRSSGLTSVSPSESRTRVLPSTGSWSKCIARTVKPRYWQVPIQVPYTHQVPIHPVEDPVEVRRY